MCCDFEQWAQTERVIRSAEFRAISMKLDAQQQSAFDWWKENARRNLSDDEIVVTAKEQDILYKQVFDITLDEK